MNRNLLKILACPACKASPLRYEGSSSGGSLRCHACSRGYQITDDIPDMIPDEIIRTASSGGNDWDVWTAKMHEFIAWRRKTWDGSEAAQKMRSFATELQASFVEFMGISNTSKSILDIGCGNGGIRTMFGSHSYYGIDPLLIANQTYNFPFVKGVGEFLPFACGAFDAVILTQVLDHCNSFEGLIQEAARVINNDGSVNVQQCLNPDKGLFSKLYRRLLKVYLRLKGVRHLDTKMRFFDKRGLIKFFRERFEVVSFFEFSESQIFLKASGWKKDRK
mgnify:CR=1 FL=1